MACSAYSFAQDPPPNPETWRKIADPDKRLRAALYDIYDYYGRKRQLLANLYRDAEMPAVAVALDRRRKALARAVEILTEAWSEAGVASSRFVPAAIGHALDFTTWQSLIERQRLSNAECIEAMLLFVQTIGASSLLVDPPREHEGYV